jgi:hypothetical protein
LAIIAADIVLLKDEKLKIFLLTQSIDEDTNLWLYTMIGGKIAYVFVCMFIAS